MIRYRTYLNLLTVLSTTSVFATDEIPPQPAAITVAKECLSYLHNNGFRGVSEVFRNPNAIGQEVDLFYLSGSIYTKTALAEKGRSQLPTTTLFSLVPASKDETLTTADIEDITGRAINEYFEDLLGEKVEMIHGISLDLDLIAQDDKVSHDATIFFNKAVGTLVNTAKNTMNVYYENYFWPRQGDVYFDEALDSNSDECFVTGSQNPESILFNVHCEHGYGLPPPARDQFHLDLAKKFYSFVESCGEDLHTRSLSFTGIKLPIISQSYEFVKSTQELICLSEDCNQVATYHQ